MACNQCKGGGVVVAPKDDPPITGAGPVGLSLAVDIAVQHYADHLPFHRIATRYARDGLTIDRATLSRVGGRVADALQLVVGAMEAELLSSDAVMGIDGTGIKFSRPAAVVVARRTCCTVADTWCTGCSRPRTPTRCWRASVPSTAS